MCTSIHATYNVDLVQSCRTKDVDIVESLVTLLKNEEVSPERKLQEASISLRENESANSVIMEVGHSADNKK